jgi:hypothetical protein
MARARFDDVRYRIVVEPARPRRRPPRRWALCGAAAVIAVGGVALWPHTNAVSARRQMHYGAAGLPPRAPVAVFTSATSADLARAERFKRNPAYGRILREAAKAATRSSRRPERPGAA